MIKTKYTKPKALIVGAQGQVGSQLMKALQKSGGNERVLPTALAQREAWLQLDLGELNSWTQAASLLDHHVLDMVLCVGGMTYVDGCESKPDLAYRINGRGTGALAAYAERRALPFVYYSTDYVFAGGEKDSGPYSEDAPLQPINVYGRSKAMGESEVLAAHSKALVIRTTVVYGPDERQKNYLYSLMRSLKAGTPILVPKDQISTPTYNRDLAQITIGLVEGGAHGIFHVCGPELLGRLDFARQVAEGLALDGSLLVGLLTAELNQKALRPLNAGLKTDKLRKLYPQLHMRTLVDSLKDCDTDLQAFLANKNISSETAATQ